MVFTIVFADPSGSSPAEKPQGKTRRFVALRSFANFFLDLFSNLSSSLSCSLLIPVLAV
ncbi:MAG: hypothetical protein JXM74_08065 [Fusobacteriaceae bacterium]|nr:hypothetical protein [Fusobacteriaceae bacterium]